jgi:hypothetical protein
MAEVVRCRRISEALDLTEKDVRLHDPRESRLWTERAYGEAFDTLVADAHEAIRAGDGDFGPLFSPLTDLEAFDEDRAEHDARGNIGDSRHGRGGFRTCDLSRVKRALSH